MKYSFSQIFGHNSSKTYYFFIHPDSNSMFQFLLQLCAIYLKNHRFKDKEERYFRKLALDFGQYLLNCIANAIP